MSMCLNIGVTLLASNIEINIVLSSQFFLYKTNSNLNVLKYSSKSFSFNNINTDYIVFQMYCWCTSVEWQWLHISPDNSSFLDRLVHVSNLSIRGVRGYGWLNMYFTENSNTKYIIKNTWNWPSYVDNSSIIRILMIF